MTYITYYYRMVRSSNNDENDVNDIVRAFYKLFLLDNNIRIRFYNNGYYHDSSIFT